VTIIRLTEGLDSGPIALQEPLAIAAGEGAGSLIPRLAELGGELVVRALDLREAGELELREQDDAEATYAEKIAAEDRRLDPARPAAELERTVRALTPHIGAYLELEGGERLRVCAAELWAPGAGVDADAEADVPPIPLTSGELSGRHGELLLGTGDGVLSLVEVQPPGKRPMPAEAYLRGHPAPSRTV
jgi:methionyl-tRNA formyltransferase